MAFTSDRYSFPRPKKRSEQSDLLKDAEDAFYGGGNSQRPTPTPTPVPKPTSLAMLGQPIGLGTSTNGASRARRSGGGITNVSPDDPVSQSQYLGPNGSLLGPQYNRFGSVNPLPRGAVGIQGSQQDAFNTSLNGSQPQSSQIPTPGRPMTHVEMATDIAKRNLTASGSQLGNTQSENALPSGVQPYISPEEAARKSLQWTGGNVGWQPYLSPEQMTAQNLQYTGGPSSGSVNAPSQQTIHFLPPGFTTAVGSTGVPNSTPNDIHFLPPGFTSVQGTKGQNGQLQFQPPDKTKDQGYGSAYGY